MLSNLKCWGNLREIGAEAIDPLEGHWSYDKNIAMEKNVKTQRFQILSRMRSLMLFFLPNVIILI